MGETTGISYCDATWNPWYGCHPVPGSPACDHCFARRDMRRWGIDPDVVHRAKPATFEAPVKWAWKQAARYVDQKRDAPHSRLRVLTCSWSDFFISEADQPGWRDGAFSVIRSTPGGLTYLVLTKRDKHMKEVMTAPETAKMFGNDWPPENMKLGVTVEDSDHLYRVESLMEMPAAGRWVSAEPLLGPVDLREYLEDAFSCPICGRVPRSEWTSQKSCGRCMERDSGSAASAPLLKRDFLPYVDWLICGGESGPNARPMNLEWARSLLSQCREAGVPAFVKQLGTAWAIENHAKDRHGADWNEWPPDLRVRQIPEGW